MGVIRVISGSAGGRKLRSVPGDTTRPITDKVRQALFNIIGLDIEGATFFDMFGGTGSVGIEALSRGAEYALFIDSNRRPIETIRANLKITQLDSKAKVIQADAFAHIERGAERQYDYVFIAPPQYKGLWKRALLVLDAHPEWMSEDAWVIVQIHPREEAEFDSDQQLENMKMFDRRRYGSTLLIFFERQGL